MKPATLLAALAIAVVPVAFATSHDYSAKAPAAAAAAAPTTTEGEVRKVDVEASKITLKHGQIENLGMPPMTMVFTVKDPTMLQNVKQGDKVRFSADKVNGVFTLTQIEKAK
jgi:Cu(I)/Ag(I) efflux system periplasmic protein CusF